MAHLSRSNQSLEVLAVFLGGRKTGEPSKKPSEQAKNQHQNRPTYDTGLESSPGHIGGRQALHYCPIPAPNVGKPEDNSSVINP